MKTNALYYGDNLPLLRNRDYFPDAAVDLVYLDPPFNSKADYNLLFREASGAASDAQIHAFADTWKWNEAAYHDLMQTAPPKVSALVDALVRAIGHNDMTAYLTMMAARLIELRRVLKDTGSIYLHCDPTASHYIKLITDTVFGPVNFRNEIAWLGASPKSYVSRRVSSSYDVLFYYAKSESSKFGMVHMPHADRGGRIVWSPGVAPTHKRYRDEMLRTPTATKWTDIQSIQPHDGERLGYETQKPLALLERIVAASSNAGDVVLDPFCGSGATIVAAHKLGRRWIGIDITHLAIAVTKKRLADSFGIEAGRDYQVVGEPADVASARALAAQDRYQFQCWATGLIDAQPISDPASGKGKKGADRGIAGVITFSDGPSRRAERAIVSVESGAVTVSQVRDLKGMMEREKAALGVFITLEPPTAPMRVEAAADGYYHSELWQLDVPRIQIATIEELLAGRRPDIPRSQQSPYAQATRIRRPAGTQSPLA